MRTGQRAEVQEQCKQAHVDRTERQSGSSTVGGGVGGPALNMGKFGERGRRVKKSQQESSLDDRRNLISKIHKSPSEGRRTMRTKEASVRVNTDLLLGIKWIGPTC